MIKLKGLSQTETDEPLLDYIPEPLIYESVRADGEDSWFLKMRNWGIREISRRFMLRKKDDKK